MESIAEPVNFTFHILDMNCHTRYVRNKTPFLISSGYENITKVKREIGTKTLVLPEGGSQII